MNSKQWQYHEAKMSVLITVCSWEGFTVWKKQSLLPYKKIVKARKYLIKVNIQKTQKIQTTICYGSLISL